MAPWAGWLSLRFNQADTSGGKAPAARSGSWKSRRCCHMAEPVSLERVAALAAQLSPAERRRLAEMLLRELAADPATGTARRRFWREIRGSVAYPLFGEDAQDWVSRTRLESDEQRERHWRHDA